MKKLILLLLFFCASFSFYSFGQERANEVRKQLSISIDGQSEKMIHVPGWSRMENQAGKFWDHSDTTYIQSYLPCCTKDGFESLQMYKFIVEGQICYLLCIKYYDDEMRIFAFNSSSLLELQNIVDKADGQSHRAMEIKYCNYIMKDAVKSFNPEIAIKDKEMIRLLLLGKGEYVTSNFCSGASLFTIQSQVLKGDIIIRFNILPWIGSYGDFPMAVTNNYFELKKRDFEKLYEFVPYENEMTYIKQGREKFKLRNYTEAISEYTNAIRLNPNNSQTYSDRAVAKYYLNEYFGAIEDFSKAIDLCPKEKYTSNNIDAESIANYYLYRGMCKMELQDYNGVVEDVLKHNYWRIPTEDTYFLSGKANFSLRKYEAAASDFSWAIQNNQAYAEYYGWRGLTYKELKDYNRALTDFSKIIELNPKDPLGYTMSAFLKNKLQNYNGAIADCDKALEIEPNDSEAYNNRGLAKIKLNDNESGCADLRKAVELGFNGAKELLFQYCK